MSTSKRPGGPVAAARTDARQRVVVKTSFHLHNATGRGSSPGRLREHLRYLQREAASLSDASPRLFTGEPEVDAVRKDVVAAWAQDRHHYRVIVSPENGADLASLEDYTRAVVAGWEQALQRELEWVGAVHHNTDQPHAHVVIRGVSEGKNLTLHRDFVKHGMRLIAEEQATRELGPRTLDQVREAYRLQVGEARATDLDRALARGVNHGRVDVRQVPASHEARVHLVGRLQTLGKMGLARHVRGHVYAVDRDLLKRLGELAERDRVGQEVRRHFGKDAARVRSFVRQAPAEPVVGRVVARGLTRGGARGFVALDTAQGPVYVEVPAAHAPPVEERGVVRVNPVRAPEVDPRFAPSLRRGLVTDAALAEGGAAGVALRERLVKLVSKGEARRRRRGFKVEAGPAATLVRQSGVDGGLVSVRVISSRDPGQSVRGERWNALDGFIVRGEAPSWPGGAAQLAERVAYLEAERLVWRTDAGEVRFGKGVTVRLREAERLHASAEAAGRLGLRVGAEADRDAGVSVLVDRVELAQGPAAVLQRGDTVSVELLADVRELRSIRVGAEVDVRREPGGRGVRVAERDAGSSREQEAER